jgi:uncharacterized protein
MYEEGMMGDKIPIREGLFSDRGDGALLGSKCKACGRIYFPKASFCYDCLEKNMEEVVLSRRGRLYSYTVGRMPSTHFQPPYALGLIDLPEGIRIFGPLATKEDTTFEVGMEMEVSLEGLWSEGDTEFIGYRFKPIETQGCE